MSSRRAVIVTGGASGIGKAAVEKLLREGCVVTIADVNVEAGEALAARHAAAGASMRCCRAPR